MTVLQDPSEWPVVRDGGQLVNVEMEVRKEEAIERGLWKEQKKTHDKERKHRHDKKRDSGKK